MLMLPLIIIAIITTIIIMIIQHFKKSNTRLYLPIATLPTKDNVKLRKQLNEGFKRYVYWNEYMTKIETKNLDEKI